MPRKEKKYHFIYKTTNLLNGKYYIGMHSADSLNDGYLGSGKRLRYSINKHGKSNHVREILELFDTREELVRREKEVVCLDEIAKELCLNLVIGGEGGDFMTKKQRLKIVRKGGKALALKRKTDSVLKEKFSKLNTRNLTQAHIDGKIKYDTFKGKIHTEETKKLMRESSKGIGLAEKNSQFGTCWITKDGENKKIKKDDLNQYKNIGWNLGRV